MGAVKQQETFRGVELAVVTDLMALMAASVVTGARNQLG
jgi:hypothetical protein